MLAHATSCTLHANHARRLLPSLSLICWIGWFTGGFLTSCTAASHVLIASDGATATMSRDVGMGRRPPDPDESRLHACSSWAQKVHDDALHSSSKATTNGVSSYCRVLHENACQEFWGVGTRWACHQQCLALSYNDYYDNKNWCLAITNKYMRSKTTHVGAVAVIDKFKQLIFAAGTHLLGKIWASMAKPADAYTPGFNGTYAQNYQDQWIAAVARHNGWNRSNGFFLDLGAYDGLKCSNTALIEKTFGWRGVCVEPRPLPNAFSQRSCTVVTRPLSDVSGRTVRFGGIPGDQGQRINYPFDLFSDNMTTLSGRDLIDCLNFTGQNTSETSKCQGVPSGQQIPSFINFISVDIEGQGVFFLRSFPYDRIQVGAWVVEASRDVTASASSILVQNGYLRVPVQNPGVDQYFVHPRFWHESLVQKEWREHPLGSSGC